MINVNVFGRDRVRTATALRLIEIPLLFFVKKRGSAVKNDCDFRNHQSSNRHITCYFPSKNHHHKPNPEDFQNFQLVNVHSILRSSAPNLLSALIQHDYTFVIIMLILLQ